MTGVDELLDGAATGDPTRGPFTRNGRYHAIHPETGKATTFQRTTNFVKLLADDYHLQLWQQRMVLLGAAMRPDLAARAIAAGADDKKTLNALAGEAKEAAGSNKGSNLGTAMHDLTDRADRGEQLELPPTLAEDLAAYHRALADHEVTVRPELIERVVCLPELGVAGKFDRIVGWSRPTDVIGDLKTQASVEYGFLEIAMQLAVYARAPWMWEPGAGWVSKPAVDLDEALVFHLPAGQGRCELYVVDIAAGWEACQKAAEVQAWRRRSKGLARSLATADTDDLEALLEASVAAAGTPTREGGVDRGGASEADSLAADAPVPVDPTPAPASGDGRFLAERVEWLKGRLARALELLGDQLPPGFAWPEGVPKFRDGGPRTWDEAALVEDFCSELDKAVRAPFPEERPPGPDDPFEAFQPKAPLSPAPPPVRTPTEVHAELKARFQAIAAEDIRTAATAEAKELEVADVAHLDDDQVSALAGIVERAETAWNERKAYVAARLQGWDDVEVEALRSAVAGDRALDALRVDDVERLDCLLGALDGGTVALRYELDAATVESTPAAEEALVAAAGGAKKQAWELAKTAAARHGRPKPRSVTVAAADPVLVALVAHQRPAGEAA